MTALRVLITGGNKGIGLETTRLFLEKGHHVTVVARNTSALLASLPASLADQDKCRGIDFDLTNINALPQLVEKVGDIDVLVNNAGVLNTGTWPEYPQDKKQVSLALNLEAPVELMTQFSRGMAQRGFGRIVNNASLAAHTGHQDIWYGMTKAALVNATKSFAKLLGQDGIMVNAVAPGPAETDMLHSIPQERRDAIAKTVYCGRFAKPHEIAETILWLGTESPQYISGVCIDINNGSFPR